MSSTTNSLPNPRVVVTGHNDKGQSVFSSDQVLELFTPFGPALSSFSVFDARSTVPVSNQEAAQDLSKILPRCPPDGVMFCITNIPPQFNGVPMHRTLSRDYCVVLSGEIVLELDSGEEKTVKAGEFIVQGGANHRWVNRTDEVCRIVCVMVGAEKVKLANGEEFEETVFKK